MGALAAPKIERAGVYAPKGWDTGWKAAKAAAATTAAEVMFVGDSVTAGQPGNAGLTNTQDWLNEGYYGVLRDTLAARVSGGLRAQFYGWNESVKRNANYHYANGAGTAVSSPIEFNDGSARLGGGHDFSWANDQNGWWYIGRSSDVTDWTTSGTWMVKFTPYETDVIRIDALYANYFGTNPSTWYYGTSADGTGKTQTGSIATAAYGVTSTTVWTGAAAQPTVYIGKQSSAQGLALLGFVAYRVSATGGLRVGRHAFTGITSVALSDQGTGLPTDRIKQLFGGYDGSTYGAVGFPTAPHLAIFALGINDCNKTATLASGYNGAPNVVANVIRRCIEAGRRARSDMSFLILSPFYPAQDYADTSGFARNGSWLGYVRAARGIAEEYSCAHAVVNQRWGALALASGYVAATDGHPITAGYADMASMLAGVL